MIPPIDWFLLGKAVAHYVAGGYTYIEAPWFVDHAIQKMTFEGDAFTEINYKVGEEPVQGSPHFLVASGEQSLLALDLPPGRYVTCTPCFRVEDTCDFLTRPYFMKVELFDNRDEPSASMMLSHAREFMRQYVDYRDLIEVETSEGTDLTIAGIEVGSYGFRGNWAYGTGLALPRFGAAIGVLKMQQLPPLPRITR